MYCSVQVRINFVVIKKYKILKAPYNFNMHLKYYLLLILLVQVLVLLGGFPIKSNYIDSSIDLIQYISFNFIIFLELIIISVFIYLINTKFVKFMFALSSE